MCTGVAGIDGNAMTGKRASPSFATGLDGSGSGDGGGGCVERSFIGAERNKRQAHAKPNIFVLFLIDLLFLVCDLIHAHPHIHKKDKTKKKKSRE